MSRFLELVAAAALTFGAAGYALAQSSTASPGGAAGSTTTTPAPATKQSQDDLPPALPGAGGIQSQNIFEVKPDADKDKGYMQQNTGQRNAVQPGNNSPMWRDVKSGVTGYSSLPYAESGNLIQGQVQYPGSKFTSAGEAWRQVRNNWIVPYGGALVIISILALAIFWFARGPIGHHPAVGGGGRRIERFTPFERAAHWTNAIAFVVLGISGIVMAFGKFFLLPVIGQVLFGYFTYLMKNLHNFFGPLFAVSLLIVIITFIKDEFPRRGDMNWLLKAGGVFSKSGNEPPTHRFNAGEKVVFWLGVVLLGIIVVGSGLVLDKVVPNMDYVRATMQQAHMIHAAAAVFMICLIGFHIYLGTVGVRGAYRTMRDGYVDEAWAQEHHGYWYDDIKAGRIPAQRSKQAAPIVDDTQAVRPV